MAEKRLGLIVNPVAGIGGRVGLKGSDGIEIQAKARDLGAVPQALDRTIEAMERLKAVEDLEIITYPGEMGADAARASGLEPREVGAITAGSTSAQDTMAAAREMLRSGVDLLLFAGGDGTARDIHSAVDGDLVVLGIPAGVKIHSAVYATSPRAAGSLAALYLQGRVVSTREAEVIDLDEDAFRGGVVSTRLYGYLNVPFRTNLVQSLKLASTGGEASQAAIGQDIAESMEEGCLYILGPGTTTRAISDELGLDKTLLGVDVILNRRLVAKDVSEAQLLALLDGQPRGTDNQVRIVVTPIGGQGYIFGRGNQQISPTIIRRVGRENIIVVSTREKLQILGTHPLRVDTGSREVDEILSGYITVVTGYHERAVRRVVA